MINIVLADSIGTAFYEGEGDVYLEIQSQQSTAKSSKTASNSPLTTHHSLLHFNNRFEMDGMQFEEPQPNLFSFSRTSIPAN